MTAVAKLRETGFDPDESKEHLVAICLDGAAAKGSTGRMTPRAQTCVLWMADHEAALPAFPSLNDFDISIRFVHATDGRVPQQFLNEIESPVDCIVLQASSHDDACRLLIRQLTALVGTPILAPMLWIGESEDSCLQGIDLGASDFLLKPFTERELLLRLRGMLRRTQPVLATTSDSDQANEPLRRCGSLAVDCGTRECWLNGKPLELTGSQFTVLECLLREPCKIVSRDDLAMALYGRRSSPFERTIDVHISNLRRKIEVFGDLRIRTARGTGYFLAPVRSSV